MTKEKLITLILDAARHAGVRVSIGGGIAVNTWGYRRETADVDAFFHDRDRPALLRSLHEILPADCVLEKLDPSHWMIVPEENSPDERIDILFAVGDPEESAIEMAVTRRYRKIDVPVFPADLLVASKFLADRGEPRDLLDIHALIERGACSAEDVRQRLLQMGLTEDADESFPRLLDYLAKIPRRKA